MKQSKQTKRTLVLSVLSVVLCLAMLVGTTFAWFTDTASTGVNKIVSGKLKIQILYSYDGTEFKEADENTKIFNENGKFEPGYTQVVYLKVKNAGNLAFKYDLSLNCENFKTGKNVLGDRYRLSDYLKVGSATDSTVFTTRDEAIAAVAATAVTASQAAPLTGGSMVELLPNAESPVYATVVYMPTTVGNEANPKYGFSDDPEYWAAKVKFQVVAHATQATVEYDSKGNTYDKDAPEVMESASFTYGNHEFTKNMQANGAYGVIQAAGGTAIINCDVNALEGLNKGNPAAMAVYVAAGRNGSPKVTINGGNFTNSVTTESDHYDLIYVDEGTVEINDGTFKCVTPKWTLNCKDGSASLITVYGGRFYQFNPAADNPGEVVLGEGCTVTQDGDWYVVSRG